MFPSRYRLYIYISVANAWGYNWVTLFLGEVNTGTWSSRFEGVPEIESIKYTHVSRETQTRERLRWRGPSTIENYRPDLSSERAPHVNKLRNCLIIILKKKKKEKLGRGPLTGGCLTPRQTGLLTAGLNITHTVTIEGWCGNPVRRTLQQNKELMPSPCRQMSP
jgi:hypothetical protein